jgi:hypothetical protein
MKKCCESSNMKSLGSHEYKPLSQIKPNLIDLKPAKVSSSKDLTPPDCKMLANIEKIYPWIIIANYEIKEKGELIHIQNKSK